MPVEVAVGTLQRVRESPRQAVVTDGFLLALLRSIRLTRLVVY